MLVTPSSMHLLSSTQVKTLCERLESVFALVAATCLFRAPHDSSRITSCAAQHECSFWCCCLLYSQVILLHHAECTCLRCCCVHTISLEAHICVLRSAKRHKTSAYHSCC